MLEYRRILTGAAPPDEGTAGYINEQNKVLGALYLHQSRRAKVQCSYQGKGRRRTPSFLCVAVMKRGCGCEDYAIVYPFCYSGANNYEGDFSGETPMTVSPGASLMSSDDCFTGSHQAPLGQLPHSV